MPEAYGLSRAVYQIPGRLSIMRPGRNRSVVGGN
jgi:hypothetical protein